MMEASVLKQGTVQISTMRMYSLKRPTTFRQKRKSRKDAFKSKYPNFRGFFCHAGYVWCCLIGRRAKKLSFPDPLRIEINR